MASPPVSTPESTIAIPVNTPTYKHSNVDSSLRLSTMLLNGDNYLTWSRSVTMALHGKRLIGWINGKVSLPISDGKDPNFENKLEEWHSIDNLIMTWLLNSMEPSISNLFILSFSTSKDMWEGIKQMYGRQNNYAHIFQLKQDLIKIKKKSNQSTTEHVGSLKSKLEELAVYQPPTTDLVELQKRADQENVYLFLSSLDSSFEHVRSQILLSPELPSFAGAISVIQREESRRRLMNQENHSTDIETERSALTVSHGGNQYTPSGDRSRGRGKGGQMRNSKCTHCNRNGHDREGCWILHPHLKPKWEKKGTGGGRGSSNVAARSNLVEATSNSSEPLTSVLSNLIQQLGQNGQLGQASVQQLGQALLSNAGISENDVHGAEKKSETNQGYNYREDDW